jgi:hypothetical protein
VLSIGFPISNPLSDFVFIPLRILGIDVSMTPITTDMSMMSDANNVPLYKTNLGLTIILKNGTVRDISPRELDLYDHKILNLMRMPISPLGFYNYSGNSLNLNS